jgi:hypothetical protein
MSLSVNFGGGLFLTFPYLSTVVGECKYFLSGDRLGKPNIDETGDIGEDVMELFADLNDLA